MGPLGSVRSLGLFGFKAQGLGSLGLGFGAPASGFVDVRFSGFWQLGLGFRGFWGRETWLCSLQGFHSWRKAGALAAIGSKAWCLLENLTRPATPRQQERPAGP